MGLSMNSEKEPVICVIHPTPAPATETFIRAHIEGLPGKIIEVVGWPPQYKGRLIAGTSLIRRIQRRVRRELGWDAGDALAMGRFLRGNRVDVVLAQYGPTAVACLDACVMAGIPLVPHFHGYDASTYSVIEENREGYARLFKDCSAIIAVSQAMLEALVRLGAPREKVHHIPCGVDTRIFSPIKPDSNPANFVGAGRFVEKKAPFLSILAFDQVCRKYPGARLTMAGDGPLLDACRTLVKALGLENAVSLPGRIAHTEVAKLMASARAFVQHSIKASNGDSEGTPVAILEAGASGLPVVATRHGGIQDVVINGQTGLLVDEGDIDGMAECMIRLAMDAALAKRLGRTARDRICAEFSMEKSIGNLWAIIETAIQEPRKG